MTGGHYNNLAHGLFKWEPYTNTDTDFTIEQIEYKDNDAYGKRTDYHGTSGATTIVDNHVSGATDITGATPFYSRNDISNPETEAWFSIDGQIINALTPNWLDYVDLQ